MDATLSGLAVASSRNVRAAIGLRAEQFEEIVRQHQRRIFRVLLSFVRDADAADTLTQECFLRAYRMRASFRGESSIVTWLLRIAVNLARDHRKNRRRAFWSRLFGRDRMDVAAEAVLAVSDPRPSQERALLASEELAVVWSVVDALPDRQRTVFLLRFVEEMSIEEIAHSTGLEPGTVKSHLHRAVHAVRVRLGQRSNT